MTTAKIGDGAVGAEKIADGAVGAAKSGAGAVTGTAIADGAVSAAKLAPDAQPTAVAAMWVGGTGAIISSSSGVSVVKAAVGTYCIGLPFAPVGGAASTTGTSATGTTAQVSVPAASVCDTHPGFQSATVFTVNASAVVEDLNWTAVFR